MDNKWWYKAQKESAEEMKDFDVKSCLDQTITETVVYEKFLLAKDGQHEIRLYEYRKVSYEEKGYIMHKYNPI